MTRRTMGSWRQHAPIMRREHSSFLPLVSLVFAGTLCAAGASLAQQPPVESVPPPAVVVEEIAVKEVSSPVQFTARVEAIAAVDIRARVTGFLRAVNFRDGQTVQAGDALFEIEPEQLEAAVASARAQVARAEAVRTSAERTLARNQALFDRSTVSQAGLDEAQAAFDIAVADVQVATAALNTAELNLSYAWIEAPISGSIGRAVFSKGDLISPDSGALARIVSLDPIRVAFAVSEGLVVTLRQQEIGRTRDERSPLELSLRLPNGSEYDHSGQIDFVEDEVDPQTGTVTARAVFPNPDGILLPGQFVTLYVREKDVPKRPIVPQSAVLQDREGRFVYLLGADSIVSEQRIETGARVGNGWAVLQGLKGGEKVIVQGIQRLADGMTVRPSQGQPVGDGS